MRERDVQQDFFESSWEVTSPGWGHGAPSIRKGSPGDSQLGIGALKHQYDEPHEKAL